MSRLDALKQLAVQAAETSVDMNEAEAGGGAARLVNEGYYLGRVCEYVDFGNHPDMYEGKDKGAKPMFRLGFALWGEGATDENGNPLILRSNDMFIKRNEKANTFLAFQTLNWKRDPAIKHFAQFLGEPFLFYVKKGKSKATQREYNAVVLDKTLAPIEQVSKQYYAVPELADEYYRLFLWDTPTKEGWDELFIEGTRQDGKSKNFLQETILAALNFQGSPVQQLLAGAGISTLPAAAPAVPAAPAPVAQAPVVAPQPQQVAAPLVQPAAAPVVVAPSPVVGVPVSTPSVTPAGQTTISPSNPGIVMPPVLPPNLPTIPGQA